MMSKLITVGLPVWNSMPYLRETMDSLLSQTERNFDILAIVDPSNDGSLEYLQSINDPRMRIIVHEKQAGLSNTLNEMLREAKTPWLVRQDSDDIAYPNRMARIIEEIQKYPEAAMFYSLAEFYPPDKCVGLVRQTRGTVEDLRKVVRSGYLITICHPTVTLNIEKTLEVGAYDPNLRAEDIDLWWRMALSQDVRLIPEVLLGFRTNANSLMSTDLKENKAAANVLYVQYLLLSKLWGYKPQPQAAIQDILFDLVEKREDKARKYLRDCNINLSQKRYFIAYRSALKALAMSPRYCVERVGDEVLPSRQRRVRIGSRPSLYRKRAAELWPQSIAPATLRPEKPRVFIGSVPMDTVNFDEAVAWALNYIENRGDRQPARISCPNAQLITLADSDERFAHMVRSSDLVVADGLPLVWASVLLGTPLGGQIRGVDLMERVCAAGAHKGLRFYILGGVPGAAELAATKLLHRYPGLQLAGTDCPPFGFESNPEQNQAVRDKIALAAPDFLIVALGSPKQERWIYDNYRELPVGVIHGVGAAVDTLAGLRKRPPLWMQNIGLEWLGRLLSEPRRLWRRYLFGNSHFMFLIFRQWWGTRLRAPDVQTY